MMGNTIINSLKLRSEKNIKLNLIKEKIYDYIAKQNKYTKNKTKAT